LALCGTTVPHELQKRVVLGVGTSKSPFALQTMFYQIGTSGATGRSGFADQGSRPGSEPKARRRHTTKYGGEGAPGKLAAFAARGKHRRGHLPSADDAKLTGFEAGEHQPRPLFLR
jgi:hypothetical protein